MLRCIPYAPSMKEEWDRLALTRGSVFHTIAFRDILLKSFGYKSCYYVVVNRENAIRALMPLVSGLNLGLKKAAVSLPFINHLDICSDSEEARQFAVQSLPDIRRTESIDYIELRLMDSDIGQPDWSLNLQNHTFVLPLHDDEEKVLALSTPSNRNHVRKVYKNDWFTVSFDLSHLDAFYRVYVKRMKELGSPAPDIAFFRRFFEHFPDKASLLTVLTKDTNQVVGGMLLIESPGDKTLYYPYGANMVEYNSKYLNNFMYWEAVRFGIRTGLSQLDLGRSQTGSGTYRYKQQWGAEAKQLKYFVYDGGDGRCQPPDKESLGPVIGLWRILPSAITDIVGRHIIKYLLP